ncbi:MAG: copper chaperone PCu(A)C [Bacteroidota bacterium]
MKIFLLVFFIAGFAFAQSAKTQLLITDPWVRPAAKGANSAFFFKLENKGDIADTLISCKYAYSEIVELHETFKKDNDMMGMRTVKYVALPSKGRVDFKPRDLHIMLIGLSKDIRIGESCELILVFKNSGEIKTTAVVRDMPKKK